MFYPQQEVVVVCEAFQSADIDFIFALHCPLWDWHI